MTANQAWQPATALGQGLVCARAGCGREFTPKTPGDVFCSGRCAGLAGVAARTAAIRPLPIDRPDPKPKAKRPKAATCALPGCDQPVQQSHGGFTIPTGNGATFKHCSREHAEVHAQARAAAAEGAGPTKVAEVLGLPAPFLSLPDPTPGSGEDSSPEPAPARTCGYEPCDLPPKNTTGPGWPRKYCSWGHFKAVNGQVLAARDAALAQPAPPAAPEPEPAAAPPPSSEEAPVRPDPFTTDGQSTAATVHVTPPPDGAAAPAPEVTGPPGPPDDPGHIATRTINLTGGGWLSLTLAIDLFTLDPAERGLVFDLVDAVNRYQQVQEARA